MTVAVVVGHGLTPKGKGWGCHIDACPIVVRMWNWHWQNVTDYGTKYDIGFFEISAPEMKRFNAHNWKGDQPSISWIATELHSNVGHKKYTGTLPPAVKVYDTKPWEEQGIKLGGMGTKGRLVLTRGVRAALATISSLPKGATLILVGFDNVRAGIGLTIEEGYPAEYVADPAAFPFRDYKGGVVKYGNHDYSCEAPLLELMAKRAQVNLIHAQDVWA